MSQCTATSKRSGERCRNRAVTGRTTCRMHGGTVPAGPASPAWKDGRHSRVLPKRLLDDYQASLADPDRLVLNAEIAIIDARINELLQVVDTQESGRIWSELHKQATALEAAQKAKDTMTASKAQFMILTLITEGHAEWTAWTDVITLIDRRRKLVESERKRLVEAQKMIAVDQALAMMGLLIESVRKHVHDDDALRAVVAEFARLSAGASADAALTG